MNLHVTFVPLTDRGLHIINSENLLLNFTINAICSLSELLIAGYDHDVHLHQQ